MDKQKGLVVFDKEVLDLVRRLYEKEKQFVNIDFDTLLNSLLVLGMLEYANILERDTLNKENAIRKIENAINSPISVYKKWNE